MTAFKLVGLALGAALLPLSAAAEITASDLVALWRSGDTIRVTADVTEADARVTLSDVEIVLAAGDGGSVRTGRMVLSDLEDGAVEIALPGPIAFGTEAGADGPPLIVDLSSARIVARRDDGRIGYDVTDDEARVSLDGDTVAAPKLDYVLEAFTGRLETGETLAEPMVLETDAGILDGEITVRPKADAGPTRIGVRGQDLESRSDVESARGFLAGFLADGVPEIEGMSSVSDIRVAVEADANGGRAAVGLEIADLSVGSSSADGGLETEIDAGPISLSLAGAGLPTLSPAAAVEALSYRLALPVAEGDAGPLALGLSVDGIVPDDQVWALVDPQGALSRDPASLTLEVTGDATPRAPDAPGVPFDVEQLSLGALGLSALGAKLTGRGSVTDPLGAADGEIILIGEGLLDLIGTLAEAGLLPPQQELGARFALGFATVPDPDGPGLRSTITFDEGAIRLNDQPLR